MTHPNDELPEWAVSEFEELRHEVSEQAGEIERLTTLINTPHTTDFMEAVRIEVAHQMERWPDGHDANKTPDDWMWTLAYLSTKATQAERYGDHEKYLHHIVTSAALICNWHCHAIAAQQLSICETPVPKDQT